MDYNESSVYTLTLGLIDEDQQQSLHLQPQLGRPDEEEIDDNSEDEEVDEEEESEPCPIFDPAVHLQPVLPGSQITVMVLMLVYLK